MDEVLDWVFCVAQRSGMELEQLRAEKFTNITGAHLCRMDQDQFETLEPLYGTELFMCLKDLLRQSKEFV